MIDKIINKIIYIIIFIIPLLALPYGLNSIPYNILKIIALLICGLILLICLILNRKELKFDLVDKTLIAFYILIIVSTIFSINLKRSIIGSPNRYEGILALTTYFLTYYCAKYYFKYNNKLKKYAFFTISISCIIGILQYFNLFPLYEIFNIPYTSGFAASTFGNRNFFGSFLSMVVTIFMALYITKGNKSYLIVSFVSFYSLLLTMTRSSWVGLAIASVFGLIFIIKNFKKDIIIRSLYIIVGFIIIFFFTLNPPKFILNIISNYSSSNLFNSRFQLMNEEFRLFTDGNMSEEQMNGLGSGRVRIWKMVLKVISKNIIIGTGPDTLAYALGRFEPYETFEFYMEAGGIPDKAHNEYLQIAATMGIPALIIYLAFVFQILANQKGFFYNNSTFILIIPIISYLTQAFFNISTIGVAPIFWFLLGLIQNENFKRNFK